MTERLTAERRRELTREALLDAATTVFAHDGYEAGTLEKIADAAGFTTGAVYSNFGSKQQLFLAVVERRNALLLEEYGRILDEQPAGQTTSLGDLAQIWSEHELGDRNTLLLTLEVRLAALRNPELLARVGEFERRTEETIARFIAEQLALADPELNLQMPTETFAALVYAANQGIWQHVATCSSDHEDLFEAFLGMLTRDVLESSRGGSAAQHKAT